MPQSPSGARPFTSTLWCQGAIRDEGHHHRMQTTYPGSSLAWERDKADPMPGPGCAPDNGNMQPKPCDWWWLMYVIERSWCELFVINCLAYLRIHIVVKQNMRILEQVRPREAQHWSTRSHFKLWWWPCCHEASGRYWILPWRLQIAFNLGDVLAGFSHNIQSNFIRVVPQGMTWVGYSPYLSLVEIGMCPESHFLLLQLLFGTRNKEKKRSICRRKLMKWSWTGNKTRRTTLAKLHAARHCNSPSEN